MKRKFLSVLLILVLACSFSLVTAVPVGAGLVGESIFSVTGGTYSTVPTEPQTEPQSGTIAASLTGEWGDSAVIGEFSATGTGGLYVVMPEPRWGTTADISVRGTLSATGITFLGTAVWTAGDDISDDEVTDIEGSIIIQPDGNFDAALTGTATTAIGPMSCTIVISGSMVRPVINERTGVSFLTIQDAIDDPETGAGDTISVAAGTYNERVNINKSLTVSSVEGAELTTIDAQGLEFGVLIHGTGTVATFDGFTVGNYQRVGILAGSFSLTEEDPDVVHILNNIVTEPITQQNNNCIQISAGTTGTVIGNEVMGASLESPDWTGSGILVAGSSDVLVSNNYAHDCESGIVIVGYAVDREAPAEDNLIKNNLVEDSGTGIAIQMNSIGTIVRYNDVLNNDGGIVSVGNASFEPTIPSGTQVHYNNIVGNVNYGVKSLVWQPGVPEQLDAENNWWGDAVTTTTAIESLISGTVDYSPWLVTSPITGTAPHIVVSEHPWTWYTNDSIQDAIIAALSGDTIFVAAGTYNEQVVICKQLTLEGANHGVNAVTETRGSESIIAGGDTTAVTISANDVIVDGFTLDGGITLDDTTSPIRGGTISNNIITGADNPEDPPKAQNGIRVGFDSFYIGLGVDGITIENNIISNNLEAGIEFSNAKESEHLGGDGIQRISNITISGNEIKGNGASGISTYGPGPNTLINNIISGNGGAGMNLRSSSGDVVTGNTITNNTGPGITLRKATGTTVENNSVSGHQQVEENKIWKGSGIRILGSSENTIRFNDITDNNYGIFIHKKDVDPQPSGNSITYNDIAGNINYGILNALVDPPAPVDVTLNWWGHASGPNRELTNGNWVGKKGDKVSENVNYKPWLHKSEEKTVPTKKPAYAQSVDLDKTGAYGWNTFSAPIFLDEEADTWAELYDLADELAYSLAYRFDSDNQTFVPLLAGDDYAINPGEGFFIKMADVGSLTVLYSTEENLIPPSRPLTAGWNLIGLANLEEMDVDVAFASIAEAPGIAGYSQVVSPTGNVNPGAVLADGTIYVGESYWVYMLGARTLAGFTLTPVDWVP